MAHPNDENGKRRVLIYIHAETIRPLRRLSERAFCEEKFAEAEYFPIFVNWGSLFTSGYSII